ncbi:MAG TPA: S41 family peptidase [Candidatus Acidoferrum sp.]|jgi:carboxyl-terminal processing protease|nr:S41 family peptidase [Candidatus Acidoferrum sp.]
MNRAARVGLICVSVAIFCYAGIGHVLGRTPDDKAYKSLTVFGEVLQKIQQDYVDEPNMHTVTAGSLHGLLESLDTQSSYLTPREYDEYKKKIQSSSTGESGITLSKRFGYIIVISVLPDSAAAKAGIHSGDIFESIGGFTTRDMSVGQAMNLLTGPAGSGVKVAVIRRGKATPEEVDVVREKPVAVKITSQKADPDTLTLRLTSLDPGRADEVRGRLNEAEKQGIHNIILDLRECGRGPVSEAISVARLVVPSGSLATLRGQTVSSQTFSAEPKQVAWRGRVSVLIDATTSGAAEVLASAIAANHRGDVVGERTFGLASEQKLITLDDGSALILTTANYYNPSGKSILEEGVTPTEVVHANLEEESDVDDAATDATPNKDLPPGPRPLSPEDPIYRKALELVKAPVKKAA